MDLTGQKTLHKENKALLNIVQNAVLKDILVVKLIKCDSSLSTPDE